MLHTKVLIIGSGPAGLTAAIYASRANLEPIIVEGGPPNLPGGQLMITSEVENFPGFAQGIEGPDLMLAMRAQAERVGAKFITENVTNVDLCKRPFIASTDSGEMITSETVIISTGASAKWLGLPEEQALYGKGISACATCDGYFFRGKNVIVVGGGDTAMEEATYLTRMVNSVTVLHRRDTLRASAIMQKRALSHPKISFKWNVAVKSISDPEAGAFNGVTTVNLLTDEEEFLPADGLFIAIGHQPNTDLFRGQINMDEGGYIIVEPGTPKTSTPGVFAAGDVADLNYKQAITAAGTGCMAAMDAERFLESISE
jgi:thioredoxin reductase (NADPH)